MTDLLSDPDFVRDDIEANPERVVPTFREWPKIARLNRPIVITEKIDGTNAAIGVTEFGEVYAQSRSRIITPADDNFGFAKFVHDHEDIIVEQLGPGLHFGEWWGLGIQRNYGMKEKVFSLFNTAKWNDVFSPTEGAIRVVPTLFEGMFSESSIIYWLEFLRGHGSFATPYMNPEGIVIYMTASREMYKVTLEKDEAPKSRG
jgi:RNA ligase